MIPFCFDARQGRCLSWLFINAFGCVPAFLPVFSPRSRFLPSNAREVPIETLRHEPELGCSLHRLDPCGRLVCVGLGPTTDSHADHPARPQARAAQRSEVARRESCRANTVVDQLS